MDTNKIPEPTRENSCPGLYFHSTPFESTSTCQPSSFSIPTHPPQYNLVQVDGGDGFSEGLDPLFALSNAPIQTCHLSPYRIKVVPSGLDSLFVPKERWKEYEETQPTNAYAYNVGQSFHENGESSLDAYNQTTYVSDNQVSSFAYAQIDRMLRLKHGYPTLDKNAPSPYVNPSDLMLRSSPAPMTEGTSGSEFCFSRTPSLDPSTDAEIIAGDGYFSTDLAVIPLDPLQGLDNSWHIPSHVMPQSEPQSCSEVDSNQQILNATYGQPYYLRFPVENIESVEDPARPENLPFVYHGEDVSQDVADDKSQRCRKRRRKFPVHEETERGINLESYAYELDEGQMEPSSSIVNFELQQEQEGDQPSPSKARRISQNALGARGRGEVREMIRLSRRSNSKDNFLIQSKLSGLSYKEIKKRGNFQEAESTLRGRFRTLTKGKDERPRRPRWTEKDVALLREAVAVIGGGAEANALPTVRNVQGNRKKKKSDPFWPAVAKYVSDHGGSHRFAHNACHKKWAEIDPQSK